MTCTAEIDKIDREQWDRLLKEFDDTTIFQTWGYGAARWGEKNLSHVVVKTDGEVVGLAQAVLFGNAFSGKLLAYAQFGPVWQRRADVAGIDHLRATIKALREEYVVRRRLCLRLRPWAYDLAAEVRAAMLAEGSWRETQSAYETYILDLKHTESELRKGMDTKWRYNLRKSEQFALKVSQETGQNGIKIHCELSEQMQKRKRFTSGFLGMLPALCETLPQDLKPRIFVCWHDNLPVASAIISAIGNCAINMNGASGDTALKVRAGYFLQWSIIRWLKEQRVCRWYDLHGVLSSPGVRRFKRGLVGANPPAIRMSEFEACENRLLASIVGAGVRLHEAQRGLRKSLVYLRKGG